MLAQQRAQPRTELQVLTPAPRRPRRLDIYIPKRRFVLLRALYYALFTASAVSFGLLMYVLIHTQ